MPCRKSLRRSRAGRTGCANGSSVRLFRVTLARVGQPRPALPPAARRFLLPILGSCTCKEKSVQLTVRWDLPLALLVVANTADGSRRPGQVRSKMCQYEMVDGTKVGPKAPSPSRPCPLRPYHPSFLLLSYLLRSPPSLI